MTLSDFEITWERDGNVHIANLVGRLDLSRAMDLESIIISRLEEHPGPLVVNLARMSYLPSAGVGALLNVHRQTSGKKIKIVLADVPREVKRLLDVVEITQLLPIYETQAEAVAALKS